MNPAILYALHKSGFKVRKNDEVPIKKEKSITGLYCEGANYHPNKDTFMPGVPESIIARFPIYDRMKYNNTGTLPDWLIR